jgi:acyl carrier protein
MNTLDTLQEILMRDHSLSREQLAPTAELATLGIDSLALVELMFQIEDRFSVQIPGDNPTDLRTVADVVAYVDHLVAHARPRTGTVRAPTLGS